MNLKQIIEKATGYRLGTPRGGSSMMEITEMQVPPSWGYQSYLQAYGQVGWLFACVNVIANSVAAVPWTLYELDKNNERKEITEHPLIDLLNHINPYQSRYQYFYISTMYKKLVGESFWQLNFDGKGQPVEMWLAPPAFMSVIPSPTKYIDHYEYNRNNVKVSFTVEEIIHIMSPDPYNPYRGKSEAQALADVIDSERYAAKMQNKLFYNDARPGFMIKYPAENLPNNETRKELMQEWDERYKGYRNSGKAAFLWGGEPSNITLSPKDMDFANLRGFDRDTIMGAYRVPKSVMGITEGSNRATADATNYTFAMYVVRPELTAIREALNKELVTFYPGKLYLDFENPVPEDTTAGINNTVNVYKAGLVTKDEARAMIDLTPVEDGTGEEYFVQPSPFGAGTGDNVLTPSDNSTPANNAPERSNEAGKGLKKKSTQNLNQSQSGKITSNEQSLLKSQWSRN